MANTFALILALATLLTGAIWCWDRFKLAPARKRKVDELKAKTAGQIDDNTLVEVSRAPAWVETPASFFPILFVVFFLRSFVYEPFQIPSGSMMPTLLIGDFILVEKYAYGIKDPITQTTLIETGKPKRGDIAVFKYPYQTNVDYIKRVVGLPGDRITYDPQAKQVSIQPACQSGETNCDSLTTLTYSDWQASDWVAGEEVKKGGMITRFYNEQESSFKHVQSLLNPTRLMIKQETIGDVTHDVLVGENFGARSPLNQWIVPQGHYFMMGDNRDFSSDSRFWGFVPEKNLVGKATAIWISFEKQEGEWPTGLRLSRIGGIH